jgi:hypothetical protein
MKKRPIKNVEILLIFFLFFGTTISSFMIKNISADNPGEIEWEKTFGKNSFNDEGRFVQQTSDGGFLVLGSTQSYGNGDWDIWLIKTDINGNEQWNKTYGGNGADIGNCIQPTNDGGYIITGSTSSYGSGYYDFWLIKINSDGDKQWDKTYGSSHREEGLSVQQTTDGGYIICGVKDFYHLDIWVVKTDTSGNEIWNKSFDKEGMDEEAHSIQQTSDGGYIIGGYAEIYISEYNQWLSDFWLIKLDSSGNKQWDKTYGQVGHEEGYYTIQTSDGGYIMTGWTVYGPPSSSYNIWVVKTDNNGYKQWDRIVGTDDQDWGYQIQQTSDGGFIITGNTILDNPGEYNNQVYLIKINSFGEKEWDNNFGYENSSDFGYCVQQIDNGDYVIVGKTLSSGKTNIYMVKVAEGGGSGGNTRPTIDITKPANNAMIQGIITVTGIANDTDGIVQKIEIKIDSSSWQQAQGITSWSFTWDSTTVIDGAHTISARSYDGSTYSSVDSISVSVNNGGGTNPPISGLVGYWDFDEGTGTIAHDSSGRDHNGSINGGALWVNGKFGKALHFDGSNDDVDLPDNEFKLQEFSCSCWVNFDANNDNSWAPILDVRNTAVYGGWHLGLKNNKRFQFLTAEGRGGVRDYVESSTNVSNGSWYHLAVVKTTSSLKMFLNGILSAQDTNVSPVVYSGCYYGDTFYPFIGRAGVTYNRHYFKGLIDDVRIYNRALNLSEIQALYGGTIEEENATNPITAVKIEPLFSISEIERGGELFLYYRVIDSATEQPANNVTLILSPSPTGSKTSVTSGDVSTGIAVASYKITSTTPDTLTVKILSCTQKDTPLTFTSTVNPITIKIKDRTSTITVGLTGNLGGELKGVHIEGGVSADCSLKSSKNSVKEIMLKEEGEIGVGVKSTLGLETGDYCVGIYNAKAIVGAFLGADVKFKEFNPEQEQEIASLIITRVILTSLLGVPTFQPLIPLIIAAIADVDITLSKLSSTSSYGEGGLFLKLQGTVGADLNFELLRTAGDVNKFIFDLNLLKLSAKLGLDAKASLKFYKDGKVGVKFWAQPYLDGGFLTFLGGGNFKDKIYISIEDIYKNSASILSGQFHPDKIIIKIGFKNKIENLVTTNKVVYSAVQSEVYNYLSPLQDIIQDFSQSSENAGCITYTCDLTNVDLRKYPTLFDTRYSGGLSFNILEPLALALLNGLPANYSLQLFENTDYGIDLDLGLMVTGFKLGAHLYNNKDNVVEEGYVINGNYYPKVKYITNTEPVNTITYFVNHFNGNLILDKLVKVPLDNLKQNVHQGIQNFKQNIGDKINTFNENTRNKINIFVQDTKNSVDSIIQNPLGMIFHCPVNITIINYEGKMLGYYQGQIINEIDGTYYYINENNDFYYYLPPGAYITIVNGEAIGEYAGEYVQYAPDEMKTISLQNVSVTTMTEDVLIPVVNGIDFTTNEEKNYNLTIEKRTNESLETFSLKNTVINDGENHLYTVTDWNNLENSKVTSVSLKIDENSDGNYDNEKHLSNNGVIIESNNPLLNLPTVNTPGFELVILFCGIILLLFVKRNRKKPYDY